ncbi:hypothetical protein [Aureliella helgolandensis]|uniref:Uncharacterized protein n=1 Tax=Aureliella helgolandensis TaxID=2527968 RepID=A0A518GDJ5_9BACT|nr:hypothetical protein [Aureliella helgolandensis]QDV26663.1 hypothetical protein Q31a_50390 [Aureliella helgolandensis]
MARIRSIKPEFCTSEQLAECSPTARLLFILMWAHCDDAGRHPASAKRLKMECFPADSFSTEFMESLVAELINTDLIVEYEHKSKHFWQVTGWHHQKIDKPTYRYGPLDSRGSPVPIGYHSTTSPQVPPEPSGTESSRVETIGKESISAAARAAAESIQRGKFPDDPLVSARNLFNAAPALDREFVWRVSIIAAAISPGMMSEIVTRIKARDVRKPKSYVEGALRAECEKQGYDWRELIPFVPPAPPPPTPIEEESATTSE